MTHIERIIFSHLVHQLFPDPLPDSRMALLIKPAESLHLLHDPFLLALLREDPTETCVIRRAPKCEIKDEKYLGGLAGK